MSLLDRLDRVPLSRPHYTLLLMGGLGYTFDGMDAAIVAFLLPSVKTEWGLSAAQLGIIGSATPFGFLFGAVIAGILGDRIGRRSVMLYALIFYCVFTLVAAAAPNYPVFVGARVLAGLGTGAESAIIAPFLAEFVPPARRGWFLGALAGFFSFGFVGAALIGRFVVPLSDAGWRWAQVGTAVPVLMVLWWRRSLPESPRCLLLRGRTAEAEQVVADFERQAEVSVGTALPPVPPSAAARSRSGWIPALLISRRLTVTTSFSFSIIIYLAQAPGYFSAAWCNEKLDRRRTIAIYRGVQRFRAHRQHHRPGDHRVLRGRARFAGVFTMTTAVPGRGRGRAGIRSFDGRSVAGGAERAAGAGRRRVHVARRAVMLRGDDVVMGMMSR
jgi:MFS transporter, putative metabolite:H+ symporter